MPGPAHGSQQQTCGHPAPKSSCPVPRRSPRVPAQVPSASGCCGRGRITAGYARRFAAGAHRPMSTFPCVRRFLGSTAFPALTASGSWTALCPRTRSGRTAGAHGCAAASRCAEAARGTAGAPKFPCIQPRSSRDPQCPVPSRTAASAASSRPGRNPGSRRQRSARSGAQTRDAKGDDARLRGQAASTRVAAACSRRGAAARAPRGAGRAEERETHHAAQSTTSSSKKNPLSPRAALPQFVRMEHDQSGSRSTTNKRAGAEVSRPR